MDVTDRLAITVSEAAKLLSLGRQSAYRAVRTGQLPVIRFGRRFVVPVRALEKLLESAGIRERQEEVNER